MRALLIANPRATTHHVRIRDHAVLQTLGFSSGLIGRLIIAEGMLMGLIGGTAGAIIAFIVVSRGNFSLTMEGLNIEVAADPKIIVIGLIMSIALGVLAGLVPAWQASRREIVSCFRAV